MIRSTVLCNSSHEFYQIRKKIDISTKPWWFSQLKFYRLHSTPRTYPSLRRKLIDYSEVMPSIYQQEYKKKRIVKKSTSFLLIKLGKELMNDWWVLIRTLTIMWRSSIGLMRILKENPIWRLNSNTNTIEKLSIEWNKDVRFLKCAIDRAMWYPKRRYDHFTVG